MKRAGVNPSDVGCVLLTHLHGDHFGGLPFLILDGQFGRRTRPLLIAGPPGVQARVEAAMEVLFPGSAGVARRFSTEFVELQERMANLVGPVSVTPFPVVHESGAPSYALRVVCAGKIIAYSGDTEWTDTLLEAAWRADIFVCEAYFFEKKVRYHLDFQTLQEHRKPLECKRLVLTHMSHDMLAHAGLVDVECAEDGHVITL